MHGYGESEPAAARSGSTMKFLRIFSARLRSWFVTLRPASRNLSLGELGPQELISRFIYTEKNIKKSEKRLRPNAFEPPPDERQLSTAHFTDLSNDSIWQFAIFSISRAHSP